MKTPFKLKRDTPSSLSTIDRTIPLASRFSTSLQTTVAQPSLSQSISQPLQACASSVQNLLSQPLEDLDISQLQKQIDTMIIKD